MQMIRSAGRIVAGVAHDIPGMGYRDPRTGTIAGFEADLARAIAERVLAAPGHIDFVQVTDEQRIPALQQGQVDLVLSQLTITPDRAELVDFSVPYWVTREAILVRRDSRIRSFADLAGARIAVTAGSVSLRRMRAAFPDKPLVITPLSAGGLQAVANGTADAASNDLINLDMLRAYAAQPDDFAIIDIGQHFDAKPFGAAVRKGNAALLDRVNEALAALIATGERDRILNTYLRQPN